MQMGCGTGENVAFLASNRAVDGPASSDARASVRVAVGIDVAPMAVAAATQATALALTPSPTDSGDGHSAESTRAAPAAVWSFACADLLADDLGAPHAAVAAVLQSTPMRCEAELGAAAGRTAERFEFDFIFDCQTFHCLQLVQGLKPHNDAHNGDAPGRGLSEGSGQRVKSGDCGGRGSGGGPTRAAQTYCSFLAVGGHLLLLAGSDGEATERGPVRMGRGQVEAAFCGTRLKLLFLAPTR